MGNLVQLTPEFHPRVWGGQRLRPGQPAIGEAWLVHEANRIAAGPHAGRTLGELSAESGPDLLGAAVTRRFGTRFPLLIKLLDCNDWLSVQVHPNDAQASARHGAGQFGKTEAWHVLDAQPGAAIVAGVKPGTSAAAFAAAVRSGHVLDVVQKHALGGGDTVFMPAGTVHALGPGLLVYEVQQTSDITYRVWDWDRPASAGREVHVDASIAVTDLASGGTIIRADAQGGAVHTLVTCDYFTLQALSAEGDPLELDTGHTAFHALTCVSGACDVTAGSETLRLGLYDTVIVPASQGRYAVRGPGRLLRSSPLPP